MRVVLIVISFLLFLIVSLFSVSCDRNQNEAAKPTYGWKKVFQNDANGNTIFGSKSELIDAVRLGYPVRIGWGSNRVEHVTDAGFLTIFDGEEVFAQINSILGQAPSDANDSLKIRFRVQNNWTKIAGTNGYSTGLMLDHFKDTIAGGGFDRYSSTSWYVLYPNHQHNIEARPLWREESSNWEKWKSTLKTQD